MTFDDVLRAAVHDLLTNGFDEKRIAAWSAKLVASIQGAMLSEDQVQQRLRNALGNKYRQSISKSRIGRRHASVAAFTIDRLAPELRRELSARILASANLIRLNRESSIQRTLQRFQGWATSVPVGGTRAASARDVVKELRRSFASLPFEERRVIVDQGHKLSASVDSIIAKQEGAIASVWRSNWRETGYDFRPAHKKLDGKLFVVRDSWAMRESYVRRAGHQYSDEIEQPAEPVFCRCWWEYIYTLAELPEDMLTSKARLAQRVKANAR